VQERYRRSVVLPPSPRPCSPLKFNLTLLFASIVIFLIGLEVAEAQWSALAELMKPEFVSERVQDDLEVSPKYSFFSSNFTLIFINIC